MSTSRKNKNAQSGEVTETTASTVETTAVAEEAEKKATKKTAAKKITQSLFIQYEDIHVEQQAIVDKVKADWLEEKGRKISNIADIEVYVKPAERMVYYVINGQDKGNFEI